MTGNASETRRVAIQGEPGAFSEVAARAFFDHSISIQPCPTFETLFAAVSSGQSRYGIAPLDNSLAGGIQPVWDLLLHTTLPIVGEIELQVRHCLIGHEGVETTQLTRVLSHGQALAQCQDFLNRLDGVEKVEVYDTAGAVKMVKESGESGAAAIASAAAAATYGMSVLAADIQTAPDNYTRFLVLAHEPCKPAAGRGEMKTTLLIELPDNGRDLPGLLATFTDIGLDVLKVDSCKQVGVPWTYTFLIEVAGAATASPLAEVLAGLVARWKTRVVGSYISGRRCDSD